MSTIRFHAALEIHREQIERELPGTGALERARNWLALGLLLAAWNAANDDVGRIARPDSLRNYPQVSVRAVARGTTLER